MLENSDRCYDLRGDNYVCVNYIQEFRKKEASTDSSEKSLTAGSVQSNFSEENKYTTIENIQDILDSNRILPIKTGKYLHIFYLIPILCILYLTIDPNFMQYILYVLFQSQVILS